jgi:heme oxygenase
LHPASSPSSLSTSGPLATLRAATHDHHERIDRLMDVERMRDAAHYATVLQVFDGFLAGWEPAVAAALPARGQAWLRARSRRPFLRRDLQALGLAGRPAADLAFTSEAAAWGSVYVLEGSALGGRVITRTLADAGIDADHGAAYFHGWGGATGAMWREARELLAAELATPAALAQACEGARRTFDTLSALLEKAFHERTALA